MTKRVSEMIWLLLMGKCNSANATCACYHIGGAVLIVVLLFPGLLMMKERSGAS